MRKLSLMAFASFLILWGISNYLGRRPVVTKKMQEQIIAPDQQPEQQDDKQTLLTHAKKRQLDKIGEVINAKTVELDTRTKEKISLAKKDFDIKNDLRDKEKMLEQSFSDQNSTFQDIKALQNKIVDHKNKLKLEVKNSEKWEPGFVYYLMMNENYSYTDVNNIQSLSENGFNTEELNYISEVMRSKGFYEKVAEYKGQGEMKRKIASTYNPKEVKDEFNDTGEEEVISAEDKIIEMNYSNQQR